MRGRRIKVDPAEGVAYYHCISRTVNGEFLFDDTAREVFRRQIWQVADFCGVQVLTYAVLSNHFHLVVRVPKKQAVSDSELLRRYQRLYPKPTKYQTARLEVIKSQLATDGPDAVRWRKRQQRLMGDISNYLQLLKQRFSIWFNRTHGRFGTLWAERFKSVLVEGGQAVRVLAAYVDLNPVRAGLCNDPKEYRFCGYAEAVAGSKAARAGIEAVCGEAWERASAAYRCLLFSVGRDASSGRRSISLEDFQKVMRNQGELSIPEVLRCKIRYFSDSGVLGSRLFVSKWTQKLGFRPASKPRDPSAFHPLGLHGLRAVRQRP
jgi:putative transposase